MTDRELLEEIQKGVKDNGICQFLYYIGTYGLLIVIFILLLLRR